MKIISSDGFSTVAREHADHPLNHGPLSDFSGHARITGPCGDTMEFWLSVQNGIIEQVSFGTDGCITSLACGSMTTKLASGRAIEAAMQLQPKDILDALGEFPVDSQHCALLSTTTLKSACIDHTKRQKTNACSSGCGTDACDCCDDKECSSSPCGQTHENKGCPEQKKQLSRLDRIQHKIVVLSGKGGVGKSTVAVNLATALMLSGKRVGLLDVDIHGPSIPTMLGLEHESLHSSEEGLLPVELGDMKVMSLGFMLKSQDEAVIWRGPAKMGAIQQMLMDVVWEDLDYLIIDSPPGTGDEPLSVCQLIDNLDGAVVVTTPQKVAAVDVRKSITFCHQLNVPVLGVVENMSGFACPGCGEVTSILQSGGGRQIAEDMGVSFLGAIPMDPKIAESCDNGRAFIHHYESTPTAETMRGIISSIIG